MCIRDRTYSEFGRRVSENGNKGTDHGTSAPVFLFGGGLKGGFTGQMPSLNLLQAGDLQYHVDFRSLYRSIGDQWLDSDEARKYKQFAKLDLFSI